MKQTRTWLTALALAAAAQPGFAQEAGVARMTRASATQYLTAYFAQRPGPEISICGTNVFKLHGLHRKGVGVEITDAGMTIICETGARHGLTFAQAPTAIVADNGYIKWASLGGHAFTQMDDPRRFVEAWAALQRPAPRDPATDAAFQAAVRAAAANPSDRSEDQRRAQVRAEALVGAGRLKDAFDVYQTALTASPDWAAGRYNAALVAGELKQYELAVTEMRRYLYLAPNAPDARAAQDQIYRWEALLE